MANGYCEALLLHLESIAGQNYPGKKVTMPGFLNMLLTTPDRPNVLAEANSGGHRRTARVMYMPRTTINQVSTTDTCAVDVIPAFKETEVTVDNIVQTGVWIPDDTIRQYCEDASRTVAIGQPATQLMNQHLSSILHSMNGIYQKMENVLTTSMASEFGAHKATGTATAVTVNIEQDATINDLGTGLTKLLSDAEANEFCGSPVIVGALGSIFHQFATQFKFRGLAAGDGFNPMAMAEAMGFTFYGSGQTSSTWGAQHIGMFSPGSTHLIERLDNVGAFAGQRRSYLYFPHQTPSHQVPRASSHRPRSEP